MLSLTPVTRSRSKNQQSSGALDCARTSIHIYRLPSEILSQIFVKILDFNRPAVKLIKPLRKATATEAPASETRLNPIQAPGGRSEAAAARTVLDTSHFVQKADFQSLFNCLSVSKHFYETVSPILWRARVMEKVSLNLNGMPMELSDFNYSNKDILAIGTLALSISYRYYREAFAPDAQTLDRNQIVLFVPHPRKLDFDELNQKIRNCPNPTDSFWTEKNRIQRYVETISKTVPSRLFQRYYRDGRLAKDGQCNWNSSPAIHSPRQNSRRYCPYPSAPPTPKSSHEDFAGSLTDSSSSSISIHSIVRSERHSDRKDARQHWERVAEMLLSGSGPRSRHTFFILYRLSSPQSKEIFSSFSGPKYTRDGSDQGQCVILKCQVIDSNMVYIVDASTYKTCRVCRTIQNVLMCSRCRCAWYCSVDCQKQDYVAHQAACFSLAGYASKWTKRAHPQ